MQFLRTVVPLALLWQGGTALAQRAVDALPDTEKPAAEAPPSTSTSPPASPEPTAAAPAPAEGELRDAFRALEAQVVAQREALAQQRAELQAVRDAQAAAAADGGEDAELQALLAQNESDVQLEEMGRVDPLRVYGFMDTGLQRNWGGLFDTGLAPSTANTFVLGNVNVYLDAAPAPNWRSLVEVRFTNLPSGADHMDLSTGQSTRVVTDVQDTTAVHGGLQSIHLNGIILERAQIDYQYSDLLNVRAGVFLTPYGIWNVDHGAPVRIMARPPAFITAGLIPERQTGVELFGTLHMLPWTLDYHAYVSNGRTLGAVDFDNDKAVGGRLVLGTRRPIGIRVGASFFTGSTEDVRSKPGITRLGELGLVPQTLIAFKETAGAGDLSLDIGKLRIRSEIVVTQRIYEDGKRDSFGGVATPDATRMGAYALAAYELPYGIEPYAVLEYIREPIPTIADGFKVASAGLNLYFTPTTQLRLFAAYTKGFIVDGPDPENFAIKGAGARLVVAF